MTETIVPQARIALAGLRTVLLEPPGTPDRGNTDPNALPARFELRLVPGGVVNGWVEVGQVLPGNRGRRPLRFLRLHLSDPALVRLAEETDSTVEASYVRAEFGIAIDPATSGITIRELGGGNEPQYYNLANGAVLSDTEMHVYHDGRLILNRRPHNVLNSVTQYLPALLDSDRSRIDLGTLPITPRPSFGDIQTFLSRLLLYAFVRKCYRSRYRVIAGPLEARTPPSSEEASLAVRETPGAYNLEPAPARPADGSDPAWDNLDPPLFDPPTSAQPSTTFSDAPADFDPPAFVAHALEAQGLVYPRDVIEALYVALQTKGFVILSGPSGAGKTRLSTSFARLFADPPDMAFVTVRPDFRDTHSLLGYDNPLTGTYVATPLTRFLLASATAYRDAQTKHEVAAPRFVVLDEMNLARVEYYFADFLSVLEAGRTGDGFTRQAIVLHTAAQRNDSDGRSVPPEIHLPPTLYFIGTVNIDETTSGFSPKVLDRAFSLDLAADADDLAAYLGLGEHNQATAHTLTEQDAGPAQHWLTDSFTRHGVGAQVDAGVAQAFFRSPQGQSYAAQLNALNASLAPFDYGLAFRSVTEIGAFMASAAGLPGRDLAPFFDWAVCMKVMPRLVGSRARLNAPLLALLDWAAAPTDAPGLTPLVENMDTPDIAALAEALRQRLRGAKSDSDVENLAARFRYLRVAHKTVRMLYSLYTQGFASYA